MRRKQHRVGIGGVKALLVAAVMLMFVSPVAATTTTGVVLYQLDDHDGRSAGDRTYTRMHWPLDVMGLSNPPDPYPTFSVLWDWQTATFWKHSSFGDKVVVPDGDVARIGWADTPCSTDSTAWNELIASDGDAMCRQGSSATSVWLKLSLTNPIGPPFGIWEWGLADIDVTFIAVAKRVSGDYSFPVMLSYDCGPYTRVNTGQTTTSSQYTMLRFTAERCGSTPGVPGDPNPEWTQTMVEAMTINIEPINNGVGAAEVIRVTQMYAIVRYRVDPYYLDDPDDGYVEPITVATSTLAATPRRGACLTWDGNLPGYWTSEDSDDAYTISSMRPRLIIAGGISESGVISSEINVLQVHLGVYPERYTGTWLAKFNLPTPVAYASCGRMTWRSLVQPQSDLLGAVVFGGIGSSSSVLSIAQQVHTSVWRVPTSWYATSGSVPSLGARYGSAYIDQSQWGQFGGVNTEWYLWGGGSAVASWAGPIPIASAYAGTRHCWLDQIFFWITCETWTNTGQIPEDRVFASSAWATSYSQGSSIIMVLYGGEYTYASGVSASIHYGEAFDGVDQFVWTNVPSMSPPSMPARSGAALYCSEYNWAMCDLPFADMEPRLHMSGGRGVSGSYDSLWLLEGSTW